MIRPARLIYRFLFMPHPLTKFEQYVEKKGTLADYVKRFGWFKGLVNYYCCRVRRSGRVSVYYGSGNQRCVLRSGSADVMVFEQVFLFNDYDIDFKTDPKLIIDAGAHIGLASLYFSNRFPQANIISLEPEPANFRLLSRNIRHLSNITPVNKALWHFSGTVYLDNPNANSWAFRVSEAQSDVAVATMDIKTILDQCREDKIDIIKIDIEGSEKTLFSNNPSWIAQVDYLVIETHDHIRPGSTLTVETALAADMQLIQHHGENRVFARSGMD